VLQRHFAVPALGLQMGPGQLRARPAAVQAGDPYVSLQF
jgi:hypothetical protein